MNSDRVRSVQYKYPVKALEMEQNKPVRAADKCAICLGRLHMCPKIAINCGKKIQKHGQYTNPNEKV